MLTKSSLKTEYSRLYPAIAEEETEEEASPTSTSPTSMTTAFQEFMTAEKRAAPHLARTFGVRGSSSSQRQKRDPLAWNCCILPYLLCLLPQWKLNAFFQFVDYFILQLEAAFFAATIDMLVFTKYFLLRHKENKFLDI